MFKIVIATVLVVALMAVVFYDYRDAMNEFLEHEDEEPF